MAQRIFKPEEVIRIQQMWDDRTIDVRQTADYYGVSPETIRRVGRRDTYRDLGRRLLDPDDHRTAGYPRYAAPDAEVEASKAKLLAMMQEPQPKEVEEQLPKTVLEADQRTIDAAAAFGVNVPRRPRPPYPHPVGIEDPGEGKTL